VDTKRLPLSDGRCDLPFLKFAKKAVLEGKVGLFSEPKFVKHDVQRRDFAPAFDQ